MVFLIDEFRTSKFYARPELDAMAADAAALARTRHVGGELLFQPYKRQRAGQPWRPLWLRAIYGVLYRDIPADVNRGRRRRYQFVNRDKNAALNIRSIFLSLAFLRERPDRFMRHPQQNDADGEDGDEVGHGGNNAAGAEV